MKSRGETEETMNSDPREKTDFLAEKLRRIRDALGLSQTELLGVALPFAKPFTLSQTIL
jgi:hypothetical protein